MQRNIINFLYYKLPKIHLQALFFSVLIDFLNFLSNAQTSIGIDMLQGQKFGEIGALSLNTLYLYHQNQYLEHS